MDRCGHTFLPCPSMFTRSPLPYLHHIYTTHSTEHLFFHCLELSPLVILFQAYQPTGVIMSSIRSRAAIRFIVALFLAQTFVNAVAVPHPHIHKVLDPNQVVSLPVVERQEPEEPEDKNVFEALVDTLKSYNGWEVFTDFFRKLFADTPSPDDDDEPNSDGASTSTSVDVVSAIESIINEIISEPVVVIPSGSSTTEAPEASTTDDGIMSILPIYPITTAIELYPTGEQPVPSELLPETTEAPEATAPIVVVVPPVDANSTEVVIALPTEVLTVPIVTAPIVTGPVEIAPSATDLAPFPVENSTIVAPIPSDGVPVVVILPTGISSPIDANASVSAETNATISLTSTVDVTVTIEPTLIGTDVASVGTGLPVTFSEVPIFSNETAITPTVILVTGTGDAIGTIAPTLSIEPISAPFANVTDDATAVAPIGTTPVGTGVIVIGTGVLASTGVASVEPVETIVLGTGVVGTGTGAATAVAPVDTALPPFVNTTDIEVVVQPTFVLGTGTAPAVGTISAAPIASEATDAAWANTTTTTITNIVTPSLVLETGVESAVAPIGTNPPGTIVVVPGPDSTDILFPNITVTVNATADATLSVELPFATDLPIDVTLAPVAPIPTVSDEFPAIPVETVTAVGPIIDEPIPSDAPVVEFPGEPIIPTVSAVEEPIITPILPIVPVPTIDVSASTEDAVASILPAFDAVASILPAFDVAPAEDTTAAIPAILPVPVTPVAPAATIVPVVPVAPIAPTDAILPPAVPAVAPAVAPVAPAVPQPPLPLLPAFPIPPQ